MMQRTDRYAAALDFRCERIHRPKAPSETLLQWSHQTAAQFETTLAHPLHQMPLQEGMMEYDATTTPNSTILLRHTPSALEESSSVIHAVFNAIKIVSANNNTACRQNAKLFNGKDRAVCMPPFCHTSKYPNYIRTQAYQPSHGFRLYRNLRRNALSFRCSVGLGLSR